MPATPAEIRARIADLIADHMDINAYGVETVDVQRPAVIVGDPESFNPRAYLGVGYDITLDVRIEVDVAGDWAEADRLLYEYITPNGTSSVWDVINDNPTLNGLVEAAHVVDFTNFGARELSSGASVRTCSARVEVYA
jgi:hypothetical protein